MADATADSLRAEIEATKQQVQAERAKGHAVLEHFFLFFDIDLPFF